MHSFRSPLYSKLTGIIKNKSDWFIALTSSLTYSQNPAVLAYSEAADSSLHFRILFLIPASRNSSFHTSDQNFVIISDGLSPGYKSHLSDPAVFYHRNVWWRLKFVNVLDINFLKFSVLHFFSDPSTHLLKQAQSMCVFRGQKLINRRGDFTSDLKAQIFCKHTIVAIDIYSGIG
jgi:hypothetical protein